MKKTVAIIGGGPSALAAAAFLNPDLFDVTIYEKNKSVGRKFLVAGKGGFNLTHSEPIEDMVVRYSESTTLESSLKTFTNTHLRDWLQTIGIPTYVGSSKRIYPEKGIKPIEVLNSILNILRSNSVAIQYQSDWTGWNEQNELTFASGKTVSADYVIFSLGGGSWKVTGSDGSWIDAFASQGIQTVPFLPANCAYCIDWDIELLQKIEGSPLKNISLSSLGKTCKGELVVTQFGLEGNAIYALSDKIQSQLSNTGQAIVYLDMKPSFALEKVLEKMTQSPSKTTDILKNTLNLSKPLIQLLKSHLSKEEFLSKEALAQKIKRFPLIIESSANIDEAISTTGGISMNAISDTFELRKMQHTYCIGEMLDWNAPTGGYLLQACFSMGVSLAHFMNQSKG